MKYFILGGNGFIARNIYTSLVNRQCDVKLLQRKDFDITDKSTYTKFDFSHVTIIDCISKIDDNDEIIFHTNVYSLKNFINYLNITAISYKYIYFSTFSTQLSQRIKLNSYIHSKILAEEFIEASVENYKIIRLIFPFGKGENKNRLLSKLIYKIKNNNEIIITNTCLNLTPIRLLKENFLSLLSNEEKDINFSDGKIYYLKDIVDTLFKLLQKPTNYIYKENIVVDLCSKKTVISQLPIDLLEELIYE